MTALINFLGCDIDWMETSFALRGNGLDSRSLRDSYYIRLRLFSISLDQSPVERRNKETPQLCVFYVYVLRRCVCSNTDQTPAVGFS